MTRTLRWVFVLLPCTPGLILLLAGLALIVATPDERDARRARQLFTAGGAVLVAGLVIGAVVAWRIAHPQPDTDDDENGGTLPPTD